MIASRFVATYARAVQIGPDYWRMEHISRVFSIDRTMRDVMTWLEALGVVNPACTDVSFSVYDEKEESE